MCSKARTRSDRSTDSAIWTRRMYAVRLAAITASSTPSAPAESAHTTPGR